MFHLITGGSGSGKSEYAEQKLMEYASHSKRNKKRYYIATMIPFGKETEEKIARHRKLRAGKGFETIECYTDLKKAAEILQTKEAGSVLLEFRTQLLSPDLPSLPSEDLAFREASDILPSPDCLSCCLKILHL